MSATLRNLALVALLGLISGPGRAQEVVLRGELSGDRAISATQSPATGEVSAVLGDDNTLRLEMVYAGLDLGATGAALHTGRFNENGPIVARLDIDAGATSGRVAGAAIALTPLVASAVRAGDSYVVVSTIRYPNGAIRGQLLQQPARLDRLPAPALPTPPVRDPTPVDEPEEGN